jgi:hypothetical protein
MPVGFDFFERLFLSQMNEGPAPMLDLVSLLGFKAVLTALKVGLFESLAGRLVPEEELAAAARLDGRGLRFLLQALEPLGYVARDGGRWRNTEMTRRWMLAGSPDCIADIFFMFEDMAARWERLDESVRAGRAAVDVDAWLRARPDGFSRYHRGLRAIARLLSPELLDKVEVSAKATRLLDLGGSHALFSARFCQRHPQLSATVLDLAAARAVAEETIAQERVQGRVAFQEGNFLEADLGAGWDVVLLFAVARTLATEPLQALLKRVAAALAPDGQVVVMDQFNERLSSPFLRANAAVINLELLNGSPGDVYPASEVRRFLAEAGLARTRFFALKRSGGQGVIVARRG